MIAGFVGDFCRGRRLGGGKRYGRTSNTREAEIFSAPNRGWSVFDGKYSLRYESEVRMDGAAITESKRPEGCDVAMAV